MDYTYETSSAPSSTSSDPGYTAGQLFAPFVFAAIIFLIGYWGVRLIKKRKPTKREKIVILVVAIGVTLLSVIGRAISDTAARY